MASTGSPAAITTPRVVVVAIDQDPSSKPTDSRPSTDSHHGPWIAAVVNSARQKASRKTSSQIRASGTLLVSELGTERSDHPRIGPASRASMVASAHRATPTTTTARSPYGQLSSRRRPSRTFASTAWSTTDRTAAPGRRAVTARRSSS